MRTKISMIFILSCAVVLRIYFLGKIPFWEDELWTLWRCEKPLVETFKSIAYYPLFPPLYYLLTGLWIKFFGVSESMLRFPSVIFSVLSVFFVFKLGEILYNKRTGLIAALLLAISPLNIFYAQEAKMYAMSWTLGLISFWLFYRLMVRFRAADLIGYIVVTLVSWYASYVGIMYSLIQVISFFVFQKPRSIGKWLWVYFFILLLYVPWLRYFPGKEHIFHGQNLQWVPATDHYFLRTLWHIDKMLHLLSSSTQVFWGGLSFYAVLGVFSLVTFKKDSRLKLAFDIKKEDVFLLIWFLFPFVAYFVIDKFWCRVFSVTRYLGFVHIPLLLLLSKGIGKLKFKLQYLAIVFIVCYTFGVSLYPYYDHGEKVSDQRWEDVFDDIEKKGPLKSAVITFLPAYCFKYYNINLPITHLNYDVYVLQGKDFEYSEESYESVFLVFKKSDRVSIILPKHRFYRKWKIGDLKVKWYKRKSDSDN